MSMLSEMQYPHWLMVAGAALVVFGFLGFALRQNRSRPDDEPSRSQEKTNGQ